MRITGILHTIGTIHECDDETIKGILITAGDATLRAASDLLCATVDIYPHAEFLPTNLECTPENYAHALARLAHAEDNLAREVRSSQALADGNRTLEKALRRAQDDLRFAEYIAGKSCQALAELSSTMDDSGKTAQALMCEWDTTGNSAGEHAARHVVEHCR